MAEPKKIAQQIVSRLADEGWLGGIMPDLNGRIVQAIAEALESERGWEHIAAQEARNRDYYRGLVNEIGELFGVAAKTADDGGVHEDVLCAKVPGLVRRLRFALDDALRLAGVPDHIQDDEWREGYQRLVEFEQSLASSEWRK